MSRMRLTQQEADPLGVITMMPFVAIVAALAFAISIARTIAHRDEVDRPLAAVIAIGFVAAAGVVASTSAAPSRAPFTAERMWLVVSFGVAGAVAEYLSRMGADVWIHDDFGSVVVGALILSVAPYCTWISLLLAGVISAAVLSILVVGSASAVGVEAPMASLIAVNSAAVLAPAAAAAGYSATVVHETLTWQRKANRAVLRRDAELRAGIARSVQQSRVSLLGREVLPFLAGVMTADRVSVADADRARELAETLRHALKADIESTWLDELAADLQLAHGIPVVVDDATGAADDLNDDQRPALTALLAWLADADRSAEIRVTFRTDADHRGISIVAAHGSSPPTRRELDRFTVVARAMAMGADATLAGENVTVELRHVVE